MHIGDFDFYKDFFYREAGLVLNANESYLLLSRLTPVAKKWNYRDLRAMTMALRGVPDADMIADVIEAMLDNDSEFFADDDLFARLQKTILPDLMKSNRRRKLRIWCAGCAMGQEAYSIAMAAQECLEIRRGPGIDILATDLSRSALDRARKGRFIQNEIQRGLPTALCLKYFSNEECYWQAKPEIAQMIHFEQFNIMHDMAALGTFDIIICRKVLSGLDMTISEKTLARFVQRLEPHGILITSSDENLRISTSSMKMLENQPGCYSAI